MLTPVTDTAGLDLDSLIERIAERSRGTLRPEDIWATIGAGIWWVAVIDGGRGAVLVEQTTFKSGIKVLEIVGLAGDGIREWEGAVADLETLARRMGVDRLRAIGRKGFAPFAAKHGWKEVGVVLEKELFDA